MSTKKHRVIVSLSAEAYCKLIELQHYYQTADGKDDCLNTKSEVIEYCLLFGPLSVNK